jgi:hypothetical protein
MNWGDGSHYMIQKIYNASISTCFGDILDIWLVQNVSKNIKANIQINSLFKMYVSYLLVMIMLNVNENIMERGPNYAHVHYKNSM